MHRSASTTRASDELHLVTVAVSTGGGLPLESSLPRYDTQSSLAKKEAARGRSADRVVHLIPLVLVACAVVLWFSSSSPAQIDVTSQGDSDSKNTMVARIENATTMDGYTNKRSNDDINSLPLLEDTFAADQHTPADKASVQSFVSKSK